MEDIGWEFSWLTRLPRPWDSPGKNTGVGCHFLLQCMKAKSESEVAQLCPTLAEMIYTHEAQEGGKKGTLGDSIPWQGANPSTNSTLFAKT